MTGSTRDYLDALAHTLPCRTIRGADGSVYLYRMTLADLPDGGHVYLHRFMRSDEDQELHNHPWRARSLILAGGYREERRDGSGLAEFGITRQEYRPGDINTIEPNTFHRVDLLEHDCWTMCSVGPSMQSWGFLDRITGRLTPWREFIEQKGLVPS